MSQFFMTVRTYYIFSRREKQCFPFINQRQVDALPLQGREAHQTLKVGMGVDVSLPHGMELELWRWQDIIVCQDGIQSI